MFKWKPMLSTGTGERLPGPSPHLAGQLWGPGPCGGLTPAPQAPRPEVTSLPVTPPPSYMERQPR